MIFNYSEIWICGPSIGGWVPLACEICAAQMGVLFVAHGKGEGVGHGV